MNFEVLLESADMRLDRAGSSGLHVGPLRFGSKTDEKVDEKRDAFQEALFDRVFPQK